MMAGKAYTSTEAQRRKEQVCMGMAKVEGALEGHIAGFCGMMCLEYS